MSTVSTSFSQFGNVCSRVILTSAPVALQKMQARLSTARQRTEQSAPAGSAVVTLMRRSPYDFAHGATDLTCGPRSTGATTRGGRSEALASAWEWTNPRRRIEDRPYGLVACLSVPSLRCDSQARLRNRLFPNISNSRTKRTAASRIRTLFTPAAILTHPEFIYLLKASLNLASG